ncbi:MAG: type I-C CRISPR-associated protein Cas7/Csd2 [Chloroflexi bacterium]|nr:type I-C CRISPR-associated protein Cas7/Csd2 [Chloroflexota bacterium]
MTTQTAETGTTTNLITDPQRRHDFVLLFDVTDGNPNGDPDAENMPRFDPETLHGWVTDVCLKRKIRDYVHQVHGEDIYVKHRGILGREQRRAFEQINAPPSPTTNDEARQVMCQLYYDVRLFGAVMTTGRSELKGKQWNCGQVRGPVQISFSRSIDPILPLDLGITRVALTNVDDIARTDATGAHAPSGQIGRKEIIPYGLYLCRGAFNPYLADQTGVSRRDLAIFWEALVNLWDLDRSSRRGFMACRGLYVFTHAVKAGSAPAHELIERVRPRRNDGVSALRQFRDYTVMIDDQSLPEGVTLTRLAG